MKALTLYQPWATLIAVGAKRIETRSWGTNYRGPLAIHAGKNKQYINMVGKYYICGDEPFCSLLNSIAPVWEPWTTLPLGYIVAVCDLVWCKQIAESDTFPANKGWWKNKKFWEASAQEFAFGDYSVGRYMWFLDNIRILQKPVSCNGKQGLWELSPKFHGLVMSTATNNAQHSELGKSGPVR